MAGELPVGLQEQPLLHKPAARWTKHKLVSRWLLQMSSKLDGSKGAQHSSAQVDRRCLTSPSAAARSSCFLHEQA